MSQQLAIFHLQWTTCFLFIIDADILASQSEALAAGNRINFTLRTSAKDFDQAGQIQVL